MKEKSPAFRFYPGDFLNDPNVEFMSLEEKGAYTLLLCFTWRELMIPDDITKLAKLCRCSEAQMETMWPNIRPCFKPHKKIEGQLIHSRLETERKNQKDYSKKQTEKAKKGAKARWAKEKRGNATSNVQAMPDDAFSFSFSNSDQIPPSPPAGGTAGESFDLALISQAATDLVREFQSILKTQGKDVFDKKWLSQNLETCQSLINQGKNPKDISQCMHWLAKDAKVSSVVDHFRMVVRYWNVWVGQHPNKPGRKEYWQRILEAETVHIETEKGLITVSGADLDWESKSKKFIYQGEGYEVCFVKAAEKVA